MEQNFDPQVKANSIYKLDQDGTDEDTLGISQVSTQGDRGNSEGMQNKRNRFKSGSVHPLNSQNPAETLSGIVERITFHNEQNGWTVIKLAPFRERNKLATVLVHQAKIFAGASMEFTGHWTHHPKHGEQFKAISATEKKPATTAALEKYLGSGLIKGVGPVTATRIVKYFKEKTLEVFEKDIDELLNVPGIAEKKLQDIKSSWQEHRAIRDVMIFLQSYGISTLYAVKIYKHYGDSAIQRVSENPYNLAKDIYGIGFFSADRIALSMGFEPHGIPRTEAGIKHVLQASREDGHCFLLRGQIVEKVQELLQMEDVDLIGKVLGDLQIRNEIKMRKRSSDHQECYYSNTLFFEEKYVAERIHFLIHRKVKVPTERITKWLENYCLKFQAELSDEQKVSVEKIPSQGFSILTGGPGCGKTTSTKVLVKLLQAMNLKILLTAPTGRAAQRMMEVIGLEAKTIHRLLGWAPDKGGFKKDERDPLEADFLIVDECSMLDISLTASLLRAVGNKTQILFIGDPDQLPSVGAGNVLADMLRSKQVPQFRLTQVFRQAASSSIIQFAHKINRGIVPQINSPIADPQILKNGVDCFFVDADATTQEQAKFVSRVKSALGSSLDSVVGAHGIMQNELNGIRNVDVGDLMSPHLNLKSDGSVDVNGLLREDHINIPDKWLHVNLNQLAAARGEVEELKALLKTIHPWSSLHHGLTAVTTILRLYSKTIPGILGERAEVQILSPQVRGSLGTVQLNRQIQDQVNPLREGVREVKVGERIFREGDRVIQSRNNYDLGVFNGDIGVIREIDLTDIQLKVYFEGHHQDIIYNQSDLLDLNLAYAITIHKSQGSEFQAVIIPVATQHFKMLFRNLIYTGLTRAKKLAIFVGSRKALALAVSAVDQRVRQTCLTELIENAEMKG